MGERYIIIIILVFDPNAPTDVLEYAFVLVVTIFRARVRARRMRSARDTKATNPQRLQLLNRAISTHATAALIEAALSSKGLPLLATSGSLLECHDDIS